MRAVRRSLTVVLLLASVLGGVVLVRDHLDTTAAQRRTANAQTAMLNAEASRKAAVAAKRDPAAQDAAARTKESSEALNLQPTNKTPGAPDTPFRGQPGGGLDVARARSIAWRLEVKEQKGVRVEVCDRKTDAIVECTISRRDPDGVSTQVILIKQPGFQDKIQLAQGAEFLEFFGDGSVTKLSDGDPSRFSTLLDRWYR